MPLKISNVDTDQIIPAVFLKRITKTGFEDGLFANWRQNPDFVLNNPSYQGAEVLVAGSDLEPALQESTQYGPQGLRFQGSF